MVLPVHRTRAAVEHELADAIGHRDHAARILDFDAYQNCAQTVDSLLDELHRLRHA